MLGTAGVQQLNGSYIALFMAVVCMIGKLWGHRRYQGAINFGLSSGRT